MSLRTDLIKILARMADEPVQAQEELEDYIIVKESHAFHEARINDPIMGFKHKDFYEYKQQLN